MENYYVMCHCINFIYFCFTFFSSTSSNNSKLFIYKLQSYNPTFESEPETDDDLTALITDGAAADLRVYI